ncbi:hypothetical protein [Nannocystis pusilla]|uniref:hypothetical protein n=1 Tax=Nannocystis pusilla TaxID=889268 RepID=UPI003B76DC1D
MAVAIGRDGAEVPGAERVAYLPARRDTLVRAYVKLPEGWVPRELEAQLHLTGGGVDKVYKAKLLVENDSRDSDLTSTFSFGVKAEHVQPGLKYSISLWETAPGQEDSPEGDMRRRRRTAAPPSSASRTRSPTCASSSCRSTTTPAPARPRSTAPRSRRSSSGRCSSRTRSSRSSSPSTSRTR